MQNGRRTCRWADTLQRVIDLNLNFIHYDRMYNFPKFIFFIWIFSIIFNLISHWNEVFVIFNCYLKSCFNLISIILIVSFQIYFNWILIFFSVSINQSLAHSLQYSYCMRLSLLHLLVCLNGKTRFQEISRFVNENKQNSLKSMSFFVFIDKLRNFSKSCFTVFRNSCMIDVC